MSALSRQTRVLGVAGLVLATAAASAVFALGGDSAHAGTPPWQVVSSKKHDPSAAGTLAFYSSDGTQVFSGSVNATPFAAYVVGSDTLRAGDAKATLFAYLPNGKNAGAWTGSQLSAASTYPDAGAPGALATAAPLQAGTADDTTLADFIAGHPNNSTTTGYQGVYELRLRTSAEGHSATPTYDVADIQVTGSTWQIVYPAHFTASTTSLKVAPTSGLHAGDSVTLTATVGPSAATGSVKFKDASKTIATVAVKSGTASTKAKLSTAGSHTLTATYVPAADSIYAQSSDTASVHVAKAKTSTSASWPSGKLHYGKSFSVKVKVTAPHITPTGKVSIEYKGKKLVSGSLSDGKRKLTVPGNALSAGKRRLTVVYAGSANAVGSSISKALKIHKAGSK